MDSRQLVQLCIEICEDHQAVNLVAFDVTGKSTLADYYIFCSGNSDVHIRALAGSLEKELKDRCDILPKSVEGTPASRWVLIDFADVLIHIFHPETRSHYGIEKLHRNAAVFYPEDYQLPEDDDDRAAAAAADSRPDFLR